MTRDHPSVRAKQLSNTSVPNPFIVEEYWECSEGDLRKTEREIHRELGENRLSKDREFFELSVEEAKRVIEKYFKRKSDLEEKRKIEETRRQKQEEKIARVNDARDRYRGLIESHVSRFVNALSESASIIERHLESSIPSNQAANIIREKKGSSVSGRLVEVSGWELSVPQCSQFGSKKRSSGEAKLYLFIRGTVKSFMSSPSIYGGFVAVSYSLDSGNRIDHREDAQVLNSAVGEHIFPVSLLKFLENAGLYELVKEWKETFGEASKIKDLLAEGLSCPACEKGTLVIRHRKRDKKPFWGCSEWPECRFTFDAHHGSSYFIKDHSGSDRFNPYNNNINGGQVEKTDNEDEIDQSSSFVEESFSKSEDDGKSGGFSVVFAILGLLILIKFLVALSRL